MSINTINHSSVIAITVVSVLEKEQPLRSGISNFFTRKTVPTNAVSTLVKKNQNVISVDVVNYGEGKYGKSSKVKENLYIPPLHEKKYLFEGDSLYMKTVAKGLLKDDSVNSQVAQKALDQLRLHRNSMERAVLKQQWDFATTGTVVLKHGDNLQFNRSAESLVNVTAAVGYGGVYWNNASTAKPLTDYQKAGFYLRSIALSGARTFYSIMSSSTYNKLAQVDEIKEILNSRRANRAELHMPEIDLVKGMAYQGTLSTTDFEVILVTFDDTYANEDTFVQERYLPEGLVVNLPTDFSGQSIFTALKTAGTANIGGMSVNVPALVEKEYALRDFWDNSSLTGGLILNSAPIVMPDDVDLVHTMQVLA